jgi:HSP20 family molecular chaperone IbpA
MKIRCRIVDDVLAEVEGVHRHIAQRAQEIFRARGGAFGHALEDWMKAERETIWRPALEVRRTKDALVIEAAVAGIEPKQFDVQVTPTELVLGADAPFGSRTRRRGGALRVRERPLVSSTNFPNQ